MSNVDLELVRTGIDALCKESGPRSARALIKMLRPARLKLDSLAKSTITARVTYDNVRTSFSNFSIRGKNTRSDSLSLARDGIRLAGERAVDGERIYDLLRKAFAWLPPDAAPVLAAEVRRTKSWRLKCELIDGLGLMGQANLLEKELYRKSTPVVLATLLNNMKTLEAVNFLDDPQWQVRLAALKALEGTRDAAGPVVAMLGTPDLRFQLAACEALAGITRTRLPKDAGVWKDWWDVNEVDYRAGVYRPLRRKKRAGPGRTTYFGVPVVSSSVCFVIDRSKSMRNNGRFKAATDELKRLLDRLPDGSRFNILFFGEYVSRFGQKMRVLDKKSRREVARFIELRKADHGTDLYRALEEALKYVGSPRTGNLWPEGPDTIIVLSDGEATVGRLVNDELVARVIARRARYLRPVIHTVTLSSDSSAMRRLSELTGGVHRYHH